MQRGKNAKGIMDYKEAKCQRINGTQRGRARQIISAKQIMVRGISMKKMKSILLLALAILLVVVGLCDSQFQSVLSKASKICLECVGIG